MNPMQEKFVDEYIQSGNATLAAKAAGYSEKTARQMGSRLLTKADVLAAVEERMAQLRGENVASIKEVLERLTAILRGETTEIIVTPSGKSIKVPARIAERVSAADKLLRVAGAYRDKVSVEMSATAKFIAALESLDEPAKDDEKVPR